MNPILLYELRQSVRNRSVLVAMMLYLAAMVTLTTAIQLAVVDVNDFLPSWFRYAGSPNQLLVTVLFWLYYVFASFVLIGFASVKIVFERINGDLLYTTTLTSWRIVWGKIQLGIVISLFFGSMTLPFLTLAWLSRGVDILGILVAFLAAFVLIQMHYASTLAVFAGATSLTVAFARLVPWFIGQALLFLNALLIFIVAIQEPQFGEAVPAIIVTISVLCTIAYLLASAQFAPEAANRMLPVRIGLTILFAITMTIMLVLVIVRRHSHISNWMEALVYVPFMLLWWLVPYLFLVFICERPEQSNRQRQQIPMSLVGRLIAFPFFSGVANAMVWSTGLVLSGILWLIVADYCTNLYGMYGLFAFPLLLFDYCATSLLICNQLLRKWVSRHWYWVPVCVLVGMIISVLGIGVWFSMIHHELWQSLWKIPFFPYPWPLERDVAERQYVIGGIWLGILCVIGLPWIVHAFLKFRRDIPATDRT